MLPAIFAAALILISAGAATHSDWLLMIGCLLSGLGACMIALKVVDRCG